MSATKASMQVLTANATLTKKRAIHAKTVTTVHMTLMEMVVLLTTTMLGGVDCRMTMTSTQ